MPQFGARAPIGGQFEHLDPAIERIEDAGAAAAAMIPPYDHRHAVVFGQSVARLDHGAFGAGETTRQDDLQNAQASAGWGIDHVRTSMCALRGRSNCSTASVAMSTPLRKASRAVRS